MDENGSAAASIGVSAGENLRPYCESPQACVAKTPGRHCRVCVTRTPERRAALSAGLRKGLAENPDRLQRKQALCRRLAADPAIIAKKTPLIKATYAQPEVKRRHRVACIMGAAKRLADPVNGPALRRLGHEVGKLNFRLAYSPEAIAKRAKKISDQKMAWCPVEFRDLNQKLKRQGHRLPARKLIIADRADEARFAQVDHELAAAHLRRLGPIIRCDDAGQREATGTHWRYGSRVMTRLDVIRMALQKGATVEALTR